MSQLKTVLDCTLGIIVPSHTAVVLCPRAATHTCLLMLKLCLLEGISTSVYRPLPSRISTASTGKLCDSSTMHARYNVTAKFRYLLGKS